MNTLFVTVFLTEFCHYKPASFVGNLKAELKKFVKFTFDFFFDVL